MARITVANAKRVGEANTATPVSHRSRHLDCLINTVECLHLCIIAHQRQHAERNNTVITTWNTGADRPSPSGIPSAAATAVPIAADLDAPRNAA